MTGLEFLAVGDLGVDAVARVDHLPTADEKLWIRSYQEHAGGMMGNAAAVASMLGARAGVSSLLGSDARGDLVLDDLASLGVDTRLVCRIDAPTFWALALTTPAGDRALLQFPTPAFAANWDIDRAVLESTRWVHVSADQGDGVAKLLPEARDAGATTSLDLEPPYVHRDDLGALLPHVSVAFVNGAAAAELGGPTTAAEQMVAGGASTAVVTRGEEGCLVFTDPDGAAVLDAHAVTPVDANGAGDAFAAAFAVGSLRGLGPVDAGRLANLVAALSTTAEGGHGIRLSATAVAAAARDAGHEWWEALS